MNQAHGNERISSIEEAIVQLRHKIEMAQNEAALPQDQLSRLECPLPSLSPLNWLAAQPQCTQYYWSNRDQRFEMAGIGETDTLSPNGEEGMASVFGRLRKRLGSDQPRLRYYGGFRFHPGAVKGDRWKAFSAYRFVVPRIEVFRDAAGNTALASNLYPHAQSSLKEECEESLRLLSALRPPQESPHALPTLKERHDIPDQAGWKKVVEKSLEAIRIGRLEKVVLARESTFRANNRYDAVQLLHALLQHTVSSYAFCFHPASDRAFIGASPECLLRVQGKEAASEALAGTRARGLYPAQDEALGHNLIEDEKECREHAYVLEMLRENFTRFCSEVQAASSPRLLKLKNCHHLLSPITGRLQDEASADALLEILHPTPAVGGTPRKAALEWIAAHEAFDRGIYAAPVGWLSHDAAEFCVAIRSGLVQGDQLSLYSGAGIVAGSDAQAEWEEIETKMANFLEVLQSNV